MFGRDSYDARLRARRQVVLARSSRSERSAKRRDGGRKRRTFGAATAAFAVFGTSLVAIRLSGVTGVNIDATDFMLAP